MKFILIPLIFSLSTIAKDVTVYTTEILKINTRDMKGSYNKFLGQFETHDKLNLDIKFLPSARSYSMFFKNDKSCFFPFAKSDDFKVPGEIRVSKAIGDVELYAISLKSKPKLKSRKELLKAKVTLRDVYNTSVIVPAAQKYFVEKENQLFYMLDNGRVDYIVASIPDIYLYFQGGEAEFKKKYHFQENLPVTVIRDYFACHKSNTDGLKLIQSINYRLKRY